jgi:hypothetical protein
MPDESGQSGPRQSLPPALPKALQRQKEAILTQSSEGVRVGRENTFQFQGVNIARDFTGGARQQLVRRAAMLSVQCELAEARSLIHGKPVDMNLYGRLTNTLRRVLETALSHCQKNAHQSVRSTDVTR